MKLPSLDEYIKLTDDEAVEVCRELERDGEFRFKGLGKGSDLLPSFLHRPSSIPVKLVLAGTYTMGLSEAEELAARRISDPPRLDVDRMRPIGHQSVEAMFVSTYPIRPEEFGRISGRESDNLNGDDGLAWLKFREAASLASSVGGRLPTEAEWEYCCRATTQSLFFFGDTLPPKQELEEYVRLAFPSNRVHRCNRFGLYGILAGEWCSDVYRTNYESGAQVESGFRVLRGGASGLWPWQSGVEWGLCVSANRSGAADMSKEELDDFGKKMGLRPIELLLLNRKYAARIVWRAG